MRRKFIWTALQTDRLNKVLDVLNELKGYKPLTLRQIYYQLVSKEYIENTVSQYNMLSKLLKWARIDGCISWDDIEDRVRTFYNLGGWKSEQSFINSQLKSFLNRYKRDLWQDQYSYVEVWIEKDALSSIFVRSCLRSGVSVVVCRGFTSISFLNDFKIRLDRQQGKQAVMLYFGDFDPSGMEMLNSMKITLREEMGIDNIEFRRIALLKDDIFEYKLPHNPNALKKSDTRASKHLELYGELAVELDSLRPDVLEEKIGLAIMAEISDVAAYRNQIEIYNKERQDMEDLYYRIASMFNKAL